MLSHRLFICVAAALAAAALNCFSSEADLSDTGTPSPDAGAPDAGAPDAGAYRVAYLQPYGVHAMSNTSLGDGAIFESPDATRTANLLNAAGLNIGVSINDERWSYPVYLAAASDPWVTLTWQQYETGGTVYGTYSIQLPANAMPNTQSDHPLICVQPDGFTAYEMYKFSRPDSTHVISTYVNVNVIDGDNDGLQRGSRASGISALIGLIRTEEVANAKAGVPHAIPHVLCVGVPNEMLKAVPASADGEISSNGRAVWPARLRDNDATTAYSGTMPMGTMLGIPSTVDIDALTLSPEGHALAEAFQDYGGYVLLRAGTVALFVEGDDVDTAATARMRSDYQTKIYPLLRVITNNTSTNVGGGGNRRRPDALPFAP